MSNYMRPIPIPDEDSAGFWEGCKRHQLTIKRCGDCGFYIHLPKQRCPKCWSINVVNAVVSGKGTVYTVTIPNVDTAPGFTPPFNVVLVELDEQPGLRIMSNIIGCADDEIAIGMPVEVTFSDVLAEDGSLEASIPQFRPIQQTASR